MMSNIAWGSFISHAELSAPKDNIMVFLHRLNAVRLEGVGGLLMGRASMRVIKERLTGNIKFSA